jgi:hypothetical protein
MEVALGVLMWRPADFWPACPAEFHAAFEGWMERKGINTRAPMSRQRLDELLKTRRTRSPSAKVATAAEK